MKYRDNLLISGYLNGNRRIIIPNDVEQIILTFCGYMLPCNVYNSQYKNISNNNILDIYPHKNNMCVMLGYLNSFSFHGFGDNLSYDHIKLMKENTTSVVSRGIYNYHCFIYTNNNELYQISQFDVKLININTSLPGMKSKIIQIESGFGHTILLSDIGNVYGFGKNNYYQLSNQYSLESVIKEPSPINGLKNIKQISTAEDTTFALNNAGIMHVFGDNTHGTLGTTQINSNIEFSGIVNTVKGYIFELFDAMGNHIVCLNNDNKIYCWGNNLDGQCGIYIRQGIFIPMLLPFDHSHNISSIKCGKSYTIIGLKNLEYYGFGNNADNQLLLNSLLHKSTHIPTKIDKEYIKSKTQCYGGIIDFIPGDDITYILQTSKKSEIKKN